MEELNKINEDPEFREYMTYEEDQRKIYNSMMSEAEEMGLEKGMKKGLKQGIQQGIEQNKIEIAKELIKNDNLTIEYISSVTGLSIEEIKKIQN